LQRVPEDADDVAPALPAMEPSSGEFPKKGRPEDMIFTSSRPDFRQPEQNHAGA
jgi:hypothetical protein